MTRILSSIISLLVSFSLFAQSMQTYKIKNLNTQTIEIGGKRLKVGDRFKDSEKIKWTSDDQVMEAVDSENKEIYVFSATALRSKNADNVADYLVYTTHASTRDLNSLNWNFTRSENSSKFSNRRVALLIANTNYFFEPKLLNPVYDCNALSNKLLELGFDVYTAFDCANSQLRDVVVDFSKAADNYDLALFFYSGHGVQDDGLNYLIPVDSRLDNKSDLYSCLLCEFVRVQLDSAKQCKNRIILFDACRSKKSWARDVSDAWGQMEGSLGTYISFSTKSGKTADDGGKSGNSPYTKALLKCIATPNRELTMVMGDVVRETAKITNNKQEPSGSGFFRDELYLNPDLTSSNSQIRIDSDLLVDQANKLCEENKYTEAFNLYSQAAAQNNVRAIYNIGLCYENGEGVIQNHQKAVENFRIAAEKDLPIAQFALGMCYLDGIGVAQDYAKAIKWFQSAAEQGEANAQCVIGSAYYYGEGLKQDYTEAAKWFQKAAEQNNSLALYRLGGCYEEGKGVQQDQARAAELYKSAAEQGEADAQAVIGLVYYCGGLGLKQDYAEAAKWFQKAAEQDNLLAQYYLGICYLNGQGVAQNSEKGAEWLRKAAERGYDDAQYNLGLCYSRGDGVQQDYMLADEWIRKAAEQGHAYAQFTLGNAYFYGNASLYQGVLELNQDYKKAVEWYCKAAGQGLAEAQYFLGNCYFDGQGVAQDYAKAVELYEMAAEQGYYLALYSLGDIYYEGQGVKQDYVKAIKWFEKCLKIDSERDKLLTSVVQFNLGNCYEKGLGVKKDKTKAVEWYKKAADRGYMPAKENLVRLGK